MRISAKINRLLALHLLRAALPDEEASINRWRRKSPENETAYQTIQAEWKNTLENFEGKLAAREEGLRRLQAKMEERGMVSTPVVEVSWWRRIPKPLRIAACTIAGIAGFLYIATKIEIDGPGGTNPAGTAEAGFVDAQGIIHAPAKIKKDFLDGFRDGRRAAAREEGFFIVEKDPDAAADARYTLFTYRHGHYRMFLPEATRIWLNDTSAVAWSANFSLDSPSVSIKGEVYVEMSRLRESKSPLVVSFGSWSLSAESGKFDIRAYPGDSLIRVTAIEKQLQVRSNSSVITVEPGAQLQIRGDKTSLNKNADIGKLLEWKKD